MAVIIASTHFAYPRRDGQAEFARRLKAEAHYAAFITDACHRHNVLQSYDLQLTQISITRRPIYNSSLQTDSHPYVYGGYSLACKVAV